jgi:hypothetical protein
LSPKRSQLTKKFKDKIPDKMFEAAEGPPKETQEKAVKLIKNPIEKEHAAIFSEFLNTFSDEGIPPGRDHIFEEFKKELKENDLKMPIDGYPKTALYYMLIHEIICGLRILSNTPSMSAMSRTNISRSMTINTNLFMAKLLAILWIAIVIEDDDISKVIHHYYQEKKGEYIMNYLVPLLNFGKF